MKNKIIRTLFYTALGLVCLYTGICCTATLHKAMTQPYLLSCAVRYHFIGYYMMAAGWGIACIVSGLILTILFVKRKNQRTEKHDMELKIIDAELSVCKVKDYSLVDFGSEFCFTAATDEEKSLVCKTDDVPENTTARDDGWRAFRIQGTLDFSLIGILSAISGILADHKIGIFAISTYNTDYVLTKKENFARAVDALERAGYIIVS